MFTRRIGRDDLHADLVHLQTSTVNYAYVSGGAELHFLNDE